MQIEDNTPQENVTPTEQEQAQQPAEVVSEPGAEQSTQAAEQPQQDKPKSDWVQRRIDQLTREKHEALRRAADAEARYSQGQPQAEQHNGQPMTPDQIRAEAKKLIQQEKFDADCNKVFESGATEYGREWDSSLRTFQMLGGAPAEFLEAVTAMDHGHKVLHALGQDPEAAERLLSLPPLRMALELARLEAKVAQATPPKQVSKAPAPITPVGGKSAPVEPAEFGSTAEYIAWKKRNKG